MDINSLKPLPAFDEPIDHIRKRISKHNRNQHVSTPLQPAQTGGQTVKNNNIPMPQHATGPIMAQPPNRVAAPPLHIRPPGAMNSPQQFIHRQPVAQQPVMQQVANSNHFPNRQVTRVPQIQSGPVFHPPMVLNPAMSGKNRASPHVVIQTPPHQNARPIQTQPIQQFQSLPNQPYLINVQPMPINLNQLPINSLPQNLQMPIMGMNQIRNQPLVMLQRPVLIKTAPQNIQMMQGPIANGQSMMGPISIQQPLIQNNKAAVPQMVLTNGILNKIQSIQNPASVVPSPNLVLKTPAMIEQLKPAVEKQQVNNNTSTDSKQKIPQVVVHQKGNSFKAPNILVKNNAKKIHNTNQGQKAPVPKPATNIDIDKVIQQNTALTSVNQNLMKMVLDKLKHTTINMLKGRLNNMASGASQSSSLKQFQNKIVKTDSRISNSPIHLMNNAATRLGVLSGFPASLDPKRVSVSFKPSVGKNIPEAPATGTIAPRTIEIVHQNLNRTMPNNMTLEPFTATTHKKNGKMSIMLTSKHTGNRPIVIEAATGNILVSHVKGPDGNAQFVIQHARETTSTSSSTSTTTTPAAVTEEVEIEAEDIITTTTSTTSTTSTTLPTTTSTGFNSVTTTVPIG